MKLSFEALFTLLALTACAGTQVMLVPAVLDPPPGQKLAMTVRASGVQVYECRAEGTTYEWSFVGPEADLFDSRGARMGIHGAGPYWQWEDGSRVLGTVKARADAPAKDAIPWLLLSATGGGHEGVLSRIGSIQRVNTAGGVAPASGCGPESRGALARVAYTADYRMFAAR